MANPFFQFKRFTIWHDKCAMKVGTDGVLLGAWANIKDCKRILDVGTGTGLIALMLAQRSSAHIDAIEIDKDAYIQATENVNTSPFREQIIVLQNNFITYASQEQTKYDLLVSNPPYFVDSLKSPDQQKNLARHTESLSLEALVQDSFKLLEKDGKLALILPSQREEELKAIVKQSSLSIVRQTYILPVLHADPKRILVEISRKSNADFLPEYLTIENSRHIYTDEYKELTKDFYLKM